MRLSRSIRAAVLAVPCSAIAIGCAMPQPPGELVGSYHIAGALTENECGNAALPAADPLRFDVQIRRDKRSGYWLQGAPPARPGLVGDDGSFSFALEQIYDVPASTQAQDDGILESDPEKLADPMYYEKLDQARRAACRLTVTETVEGSVLRDLSSDADASATAAADPKASDSPDLVGENVIAIAADSGADCARVMRDNGGPFEQLPCRAHYDLTGKLSEGE